MESPSANSQEKVAARFGRATIFSLATTASGAILGLAGTVLMARMLGATILGQLAILTLLIQGFNMVSSLGEQSGFYYEMARRERGSREAGALLWATGIFSGAITLLLAIPFMMVARYVLLHVYHHPELVAPLGILLVVYLVFGNFAGLFDFVIQGLLVQQYQFLVTVATGLFAIVVTVVLPHVYGQSLLAGVAITSSVSVAAVVTRIVVVSKLLPLWPTPKELAAAFRALPGMLSYGMRSVPNNASNLLLEYADTAVLAALVPISSVGAYGRAYTLFSRLTNVTSSVSRTLYPTVIKLHAHGDRDGIIRVVRRTFRYLSAVVFPVACGTAALSPAIMRLFGSGFAVAAPALTYLSIGLVFNVVSMFNGAVTGGMGTPGRVAACIAGGGIVNLLLNLLLDPRLGLVGAGLANSGGMAFMAASGVVVMTRRLKTSVWQLLDLSVVVRIAMASVAMGLVVALTSRATGNNYLALLLSLVAGVAVYAALCIALGIVDADERARLARLLKQVSSAISPVGLAGLLQTVARLTQGTRY